MKKFDKVDKATCLCDVNFLFVCLYVCLFFFHNIAYLLPVSPPFSLGTLSKWVRETLHEWKYVEMCTMCFSPS